jgi:hypothetical protein
MVASQFDDTTLIRMLYKAGADINALNKNKNNALSLAIKNNSLNAFKLLVDLGAKIDDPNQRKNYYQQAFEERNYEIAKFIKDKGSNTRLKPNIRSTIFYTGLSTSNYDFMLDFGGGIYEPITRTVVSIGYKYRPLSSRVLELRNSEFFQLWEKRYSLYLSIQQLYSINKNYRKALIGIAPGISNEITWSYYRGFDKGSGPKWIVVPSIGLYYQKVLFTVIGKWEVANYNNEVRSFNRFNLQFLITKPNFKDIIKNKKIDWLD